MKKRPSIITASGFFLLAAVGLLATVAVLNVLVPTGIFSGLSHETFTMLYSAGCYVPFLLLPVALRATRGEGCAESLRLNPISFGTTLRIVSIALLSVTLVTDVDVFWHILWQKLGLNVFVGSYVRPANTMELTLNILNVSLLVPVCEELLFRGTILPAWESRGRKSAILVSTALFTALHGSLLGIPTLLFGGAMMALLVMWTDSIYSSMIYHGVFNGAVAILNYVSTSAASDPLEEALMQNNLLAAVGGVPTLLALAFEIVLMAILVRFLLRGLRMFDALRRSGAEVDERGKLVLGEKLRERIREMLRQRGTLLRPAPFMVSPLPVSKEKLSVTEILLLAAGVAVSLVLYGMDILTMLGG